MSGKWNSFAFEILGAAAGDPIAVRAINERIQSAVARLRDKITLIGYAAPQSGGVAWAGDDEAPYVKVINSPENPVQVSGAADVQGTVAHDAVEPSPSFPVLVGGVSNILAPAAVSAEGDRVRSWYDLEGRQQVNHPQLIAGENLVNGYLGTLIRPVDFEQDALDFTYEPGVATSEVCKAAPGRLYQVYVSNNTGGTLFFQIHNLAAAPGGGAVPVMTPMIVPTATELFIDFGAFGVFLDTGITLASSSVFATFTGAAGLHMTGLFK